MKVKFGLKNVNFFLLTETETAGVVTAMSYGEAIPTPGAVNLTLDVEDSDTEPFYADDRVYYSTTPAATGYSGNLELALIPDALKTAFMNYVVDDDGVMVETTERNEIYAGMTFEIETDEKARRLIYYKVKLGSPSMTAATTEATKTPTTETLPLTVLPTAKEFTLTRDEETVTIPVISSYTTPDTKSEAYNTWHTAPHLPAEASA